MHAAGSAPANPNIRQPAALWLGKSVFRRSYSDHTGSPRVASHCAASRSMTNASVTYSGPTARIRTSCGRRSTSAGAMDCIASTLGASCLFGNPDACASVCQAARGLDRAPVTGRAAGQHVNAAAQMGQIRKSYLECDVGECAGGAHDLAPCQAGTALQPEALWTHPEFPLKDVRHRVRPQPASLGPHLQLQARPIPQGAGQLVHPISVTRCDYPQILTQLGCGALGVDLCQPRQRVRVCDVKLPLDGVMPPWQTQNLERPPTPCDVHVTVETPVEQDMSGLGVHAPCEADFRERAPEEDRSVPLVVMMPRHPPAGRNRLDPGQDAAKLVGLCAHPATPLSIRSRDRLSVACACSIRKEHIPPRSAWAVSSRHPRHHWGLGVTMICAGSHFTARKASEAISRRRCPCPRRSAGNPPRSAGHTRPVPACARCRGPW